MDKLKAPRGLIRFANGSALQAQQTATQALWRAMRRPRVLIYGALLIGISTALMVSMWQRPTVRLNAMRDRSVLSREVEDGAVENIYRLQVMNASESTRHLTLRVDGPIGLSISTPTTLNLGPAQADILTVALRLDAAARSQTPSGILPVRFVVSDGQLSEELLASTESTFVLPR